MKLANKVPEQSINLVFGSKFLIRTKKRYDFANPDFIKKRIRFSRNPVVLNKRAKWRVKGEKEKAHRMPLELIGTVKRYQSGLYQCEAFKGTLVEVKGYARGKGMNRLKMGAVMFNLRLTK